MPHPDNPASNLKYLWDFFPPSYNCPLREKVRHCVLLCEVDANLLAMEAQEVCNLAFALVISPSTFAPSVYKLFVFLITRNGWHTRAHIAHH